MSDGLLAMIILVTPLLVLWVWSIWDKYVYMPRARKNWPKTAARISNKNHKRVQEVYDKWWLENQDDEYLW